MLEQLRPCPLQRSHWEWYFGPDVQTPWVPDSFLPTFARPEMRGAFVRAGRPTTALVPVDAAGAETPFTLVARTVERTTWPPSAAVSVYAAVVAPAMSAQLVPVEEQRCHW